MSLRLRLFLIILAPLIILSVVATGVRYHLARDVSNTLYDETLRVVAHAVAREVMLTKGDILADALVGSLVGALGDPIFYQVAGADGRFVAGYSDAPIDPEGKDLPGGQPVFFDAAYYEAPVRVILLREFIADPEFDGWTTVQVWQTVSQRQALSLRLLLEAGAVLLFVVLGGVGMVWFGIIWGLRPLTDLREAVLLRSPDELRPIRRPIPREAGPLVAAMNALFARLRDALQRRDAFIADAAHQLRNPIASIQAQAEAAAGAPDEGELRMRVTHLAQAARHASRLTEQLLSLDRVSQKTPDEPLTPLDLGDVVSDAGRLCAPRALAKGVEIGFEDRTTGPSARMVRGDALMLGEALDNLIDNALRYGTSGNGGRILISLAVGEAPEHAGQLIVRVWDDGPGVPEEAREKIFARFARLREDGGAGCGLGLAIVRAVAERHGGTAWMEQGDEHDGERGVRDHGAGFVIRLPQAQS
ncbi:MAG: sensor histidine kinase [Salinarimonas sp.]|nr:sensor histidine kinase [Salinarimonas sp.]